MATPPTFILDNETTSGWDTTTTPQSTASFNSAVGDVWVTGTIAEDNAANIGTPSNTGTAQTFTARGATDSTGDVEIHTYTTVVANVLTGQTVSASRGGSVLKWGLNCVRFSGSDGIGAVPVGEVEPDGSAPSLTFTTTGDNSAIVVFVGDWAAADGTTRTWLTVNGITPTAGNGFELTYFRNSSNYTIYVGYYPDAGAAGSKTVGLSAPATMSAGIVAVEVKGSTAVASIPYDPKRVRNRSQVGRDPSETYFQQQDRISTPGMLGTALLENELLGGATTWMQYNRAATHVDRREVPQYTLRESPVGLLDTAQLENELLGSAANWEHLTAATHVSRRLVPQQRDCESPEGLLQPFQLEVPPPLPLQVASEYQRLPWLRVKQTQYDQSSQVAGTAYDPTLAPLERTLAAYQDRREYPQQRLYFSTIDPVVTVGSGALQAWWSDDPEPFYIAATMPRYTVPAVAGTAYDPTLAPLERTLAAYQDRREYPQQIRWLVDQSTAPGAAYDPTLAPPGRTLAAYQDRREVPQQRKYFATVDVVATVDVGSGALQAWWSDDSATYQAAVTMLLRPKVGPDDVVTVGTGATVAWWGADDSAHHFWHALPQQFDPNFLAPPVEADPLMLQDSSDRERIWFTRPWFGLQRTAVIDQSTANNPTDPTQAGYGPRWMWYRPPAIPQQRPLESDPRLLLTALLENELLGGADDLSRHRAWFARPWFGLQMLRLADESDQPAPNADPTQSGYGPRWMWYRPPVAPQQRERESDPRLLLTALLEDPLLAAGAEWRYRLTPVTHKARAQLRLQIAYLLFQGLPVTYGTGNAGGRVLGGTVGHSGAATGASGNVGIAHGIPGRG